MRNFKRLTAFKASVAAFTVATAGCATEQRATTSTAMPDLREVEVVSNAQLIADSLDAAMPAFVKKIPVPAGARVAIINLDGKQLEPGNPLESLYDHLAMAMTGNLVTLVERDAEGLEASLLEGWSDKLPFLVSSPCEGQCPVVSAVPPQPPAPAPAAAKGGSTQIVFQACSSGGCGERDGKEACGTCRTPMVGMSADDALKIVDMMKKLDGAAAPAAAPAPVAPVTVTPGSNLQPLSSVPVATRSYRDLLGHITLPTWFKRDGSKIVSEQASATHLVAVRPLTVGTTIRPLATKPGMVQRKVRIDLIARLIKTADGTVTWSDRLVYERAETFPASLQPRLADEKYDFSSLQYAPADPAAAKPAEKGSPAALLNGLLGK